jgi:multidrug efflux pump subunit AcrA (membrane-fusion protein)
MFAKLREVGIDPDEVKAEAGSPFPIDPQKLMKVAREKGIDLAQLRPGGGGGRPPQAPAETAPMKPDQDVTPGDEPVADVEIELAVDMPEIDFSSYINKLAAAEEGGEAQQKLRKFEDDLYLAQEELTLAEADLEGTKRLFDEDFVTEQELDADRMALERRKVSVKSQETGKDLFVRYEFPKQAEKLLSDYEEALGNLEQVKKQAVANLAKSSANLRSSEAKLELQRRERDRYQEQVENCKIAAERPGLVVYASGNNRWNNRRIEEGATVHQEQDILIIPDMTEMGVNLKIPEAAIQKVAEGQRARITMDAFPDRPIEGVVTKVSPVPDSGHRWMSPDQNVYATEIAIEEAHDWLKPGFTAQVEIMIETVEDVLYIPIHSVVAKGDDQVVYVANGGGDPERRTVKTGQFNEEYIVIAEGLEEGEEVLLAPPMSGDQGPVEEETPEEGGEMMAAQAN